LLLFWSLVIGCVIGVGITFCIFTISTNHDKLKKKLHRSFEKLFYFNTYFLNAALNLHATIHFHCFDILHLKQITFLRILIIFKMKKKFWFWAPHCSSTNLFDTSCIFHHNTHFTRNFSTYEPFFVNETFIRNL